MKTKERGITLIALVITIIVLLILTGVSIQMITGQSGILGQAREAKKQTEIADAKESAQRELMEELMENKGENVDKQKIHDILAKYFDEVPDLTNGAWDAFPEGFPKLKVKDTEYEVDIVDIYSGSKKEPKAGTEVAVPKGKDWDKSKVIPTADGEGNIVPVPKGFRYLEGTKDTGFVITDEEGNEFVWVPCGEGEEVEYEKENDLVKATTWRAGEENGKKYNLFQAYYTVYPDTYSNNDLKGKTITGWTDEGGDKDSVSTYGGFYIGRYEAGLPTELCDKINYEKLPTGLGKGRDVTEKNGNKLKPVSKKNNPSWNFITQANAKEVSGEMYKESESVTSQLIDSYAWDTVEEWIKTGSGKVEKITDSTTYGNYGDNTNLSTGSNGLYAMHTDGYKKTDGSAFLNLAPKYTVGNWRRTGKFKELTSTNIGTDYARYDWLQNVLDFENNRYYEKVEIATGAAECTKTKNIYDLAGNMWEWTTEHGKRTVGDEEIDATLTTDYAVFRGGCYYDAGTGAPMCYRHGGSGSSFTYNLHYGFRVVLYVM